MPQAACVHGNRSTGWCPWPPSRGRWSVEGSARKVLRLSREESAIIEMRLRLCDEARSKPLAQEITQQELAARIESTQPRVAKPERGEARFEMMLLALLALGRVGGRLRGSWRPVEYARKMAAPRSGDKRCAYEIRCAISFIARSMDRSVAFLTSYSVGVSALAGT